MPELNSPTKDQTPAVNPFDALDNGDNAGLREGEAPTLGERFQANFEAGNYHNTVAGVISSEADMGERKRFDRYYESLPDYEGFTEGAVALAGQLAGTILTPETLLGGVGGGAVAAKIGWSGIRGRVLAGAVDAAAINATTDAGIQGYEVARGLREEFDPVQLAESTALGVVAGGGIGGAAGAISASAERRAARAGSNPFDALDAVAEEAPGAPGGTDAAAEAAPSATDVAAPAPAAPKDVTPVAPQIEPGQTLTVNDAAIGASPAGPLDGLPVTVLQDQSGVPENMFAVETPDGQRAIVGKNLLEPRQPEGAAAPGEAKPDSLPDTADVENQAAAPAGASVKKVSEPSAIGDRLAADAGFKKRRLNASEPETLKSASLAAKPGMEAPRRDAAGTPSAPAAAAAEPPQMVRLSEVSSQLEKLLDVPAVRQGRLRGGSQVAGTFGTKTGVVRVRRVNDFDTFTHEAGHHFEAKFPVIPDLIKTHAAELEPLAYEGADPNVLDREGFAEFFRLWMTNRPAAEKAAPNFATVFKGELAKLDPAIGTGLDDIAAAYRHYLAQPSGQAVDSGIVSSKRPGLYEKTAKALQDDGLSDTIMTKADEMYTAIVDDLHPLAMARRELEKVHLENTGQKLDLSTKDDFYKLARMSRGAYGAGHADIMHGIHAYGAVDPSSASLRDALIEAMGSPNVFARWDSDRAQAFGSYLWSRRAVGEYERFERGEIPNPPDGRTRGDHLQNIADKEAKFPAFAEAAPKVHEWARALWKKKFDAGLITDEQYQAGLKIKDYVPGMRDFSGERFSGDTRVADGKPGSRTQSAKAGFMRRFRGSTRDVINPLETLMTDAYETANAIARNDIIRALDRAALNAGVGGGAIAERVPAHELRAMMVNPLEAIDAAAKASGISAEDFVTLRDALEGAVGDKSAAIFRPAVASERGEPIVFFRDGGRLQALRLADGDFGREMFSAVTSMGQQEKNFFFRLVFGTSALLRATITTSFDFILANTMRDYMTSVIMFGKPVKTAAAQLKGMAEQVFDADVARRYEMGGGIAGGESSSVLGDLMVKRDLAALRKKGWVANRTSFQGVLELTELSETSTRLALYKRFHEEAAGRGLSKYEAHLEASWRARDYIDFSRRGSTMGTLSRLIPFLNASIQGLDKGLFRHSLMPIAKQIRGEAMTAADREGLAMAWRTWSRLGMVATLGLGLRALMDGDTDYEELNDTTKAANWAFRMGGNFFIVPKPQEFAPFINLAEAAYDAFRKRDPLAWERWRASLSETVLPPNLIEDIPLVQNYFEWKTNKDTFTGRDIVPEYMQGMEPWLQYTAATSTFSRQIGKITNTSPAAIDHLITGFGGSWGRNLLALYDHYSDVKPEQGWDEAFLTRRFIKDASRGSNSENMFWDLMAVSTGRMTGVKKSFDALVGMQDSDDPEADDELKLTGDAADYLGTLNEREFAYLNSQFVEGRNKKDKANFKRRHPLRRASDLVTVISGMRRDLAMDRVKNPDETPLHLSRQVRGAADDILSQLKMNETRNALILMGEPGWANKKEVPTDGLLRELKALSPELSNALYDAYYSKRIPPYKAVKQEWPQVKAILNSDFGKADLSKVVKKLEAYGEDFDDAGAR